jgi:hypothetical protein
MVAKTKGERMSWDRMKTKGEGGMFVKIKDGESIEGVFRGEPYTYYSAFKDPNEYQHWSEGKSFRFKISFLVKEGEEWKAKIFQQGSRVAKDLLAVKEEYGLDNVFKIKRTGSDKDDTKYSILFKRALTPFEKDAIAKVKDQNLVGNVATTTQDYDDTPPPEETGFDGHTNTSGDVPF